MTRIKVVGTGERRIKIPPSGEGRVSPSFLQKALSATFVPEASRHAVLPNEPSDLADDLYEASFLPKLNR